MYPNQSRGWVTWVGRPFCWIPKILVPTQVGIASRNINLVKCQRTQCHAQDEVGRRHAANVSVTPTEQLLGDSGYHPHADALVEGVFRNRPRPRLDVALASMVVHDSLECDWC